MNLRTFTAGVVVTGVGHSSLSRHPHDVEYALTLGGGIAASSMWRNVLECGAVNDPIEDQRPVYIGAVNAMGVR